MATDLDCGEEFRARLRNWGRVYRDVRRPGTSNIYPILRQLWLKHGLLQAPPSTISPSMRADADVINAHVPRLGFDDMRLIVLVYVLRRSVRDVARRIGDFYAVADSKIKKAEVKLKRLVDGEEILH